MQTIELTTSQNVTIEYELADLRERFFALFIDILVMLFVWLALFFLTTSMRNGFESRFWQQFLFSFPFWFTVAYALSCEAILNGQTLGKRSQRTKVVRLDGKPISLSDLLLRAVLLLLDYLMTFGALGALLISTTERRQRLGDMAAGTTVIKVNTKRKMSLYDILNIQTLKNYTPQYPQVKQLSESDMLFVREVIQRYQKYQNSSHEEAVVELFNHLKLVLDIKTELKYPAAMIDFFKILIKDYIVLTR